MGRKIINFLEDEEISNCVKKYPCVYEQSEQKRMLGKKLKRSLEWKKVRYCDTPVFSYCC